jgi:hypothetical protein
MGLVVAGSGRPVLIRAIGPSLAAYGVYDLGSDTENRITNLSARNFVGAGDQVLIAGFVVSGKAPKRLLVRGIGPGLTPYGVTDVLPDPRLDAHSTVWNGNKSTDTIIAGNDDWAQVDPVALRAAFWQARTARQARG